MDYKTCINEYIEKMSRSRKYINNVYGLLTKDAKEYIASIPNEWYFMKCVFAAARFLDTSAEDPNYEKHFADFSEAKERYKEKTGEEFLVDKNENFYSTKETSKYIIYKRFFKGVDKFSMGLTHFETAFINITSVAEYYFKYALIKLIEDDHLNFKENVNISISEIGKYDNIEEFKRALATKEADKVIRESFNDWIIFITKRNIKLSKLSEYMHDTKEIFQRRNVIVHNQCIVDDKYVKITDRHKVGDTLQVDDFYVDGAISTLLAFFIGIILEFYHKFNRHSAEYGSLLIDTSYQLLCCKEYEAIMMLSSYFTDTLIQDPETKKILEINTLLARKFLDSDWLTFKTAIIDDDYTSFPNFIQIAKYALLDDFERVYEMSLDLISENGAYLQGILLFPLFETYRNSDIFKEFMRSNEDNKHILEWMLDEGDCAIDRKAWEAICSR